jgi:hypothetical protein
MQAGHSGDLNNPICLLLDLQVEELVSYYLINVALDFSFKIS